MIRLWFDRFVRDALLSKCVMTPPAGSFMAPQRESAAHRQRLRLDEEQQHVALRPRAPACGLVRQHLLALRHGAVGDVHHEPLQPAAAHAQDSRQLRKVDSRAGCSALNAVQNYGWST